MPRSQYGDQPGHVLAQGTCDRPSLMGQVTMAHRWESNSDFSCVQESRGPAWLQEDHHLHTAVKSHIWPRLRTSALRLNEWPIKMLCLRIFSNKNNNNDDKMLHLTAPQEEKGPCATTLLCMNSSSWPLRIPGVCFLLLKLPPFPGSLCTPS